MAITVSRSGAGALGLRILAIWLSATILLVNGLPHPISSSATTSRLTTTTTTHQLSRRALSKTRKLLIIQLSVVLGFLLLFLLVSAFLWMRLTRLEETYNMEHADEALKRNHEQAGGGPLSPVVEDPKEHITSRNCKVDVGQEENTSNGMVFIDPETRREGFTNGSGTNAASPAPIRREPGSGRSGDIPIFMSPTPTPEDTLNSSAIISGPNSMRSSYGQPAPPGSRGAVAGGEPASPVSPISEGAPGSNGWGQGRNT